MSHGSSVQYTSACVSDLKRSSRHSRRSAVRQMSYHPVHASQTSATSHHAFPNPTFSDVPSLRHQDPIVVKVSLQVTETVIAAHHVPAQSSQPPTPTCRSPSNQEFLQ
jgi:hypothetical protein